MSTFQFVESEDGFCVAPPKHPGKRAYIYWYRLHEEEWTEELQDDRLTVIVKHAEKIWAQKSKEEIAEIEKEFKIATAKYTSELRAWLDIYQAQQAKRKMEAAYIYEKYVPQKDGLAADATAAMAEREATAKEKAEPSSPKAKKVKSENETKEVTSATQKDKDENGLKDHLLEMYQKFAANEQKNSVVYDTQALSLNEMEVLKDRFLHPHADGPENAEED